MTARASHGAAVRLVTVTRRNATPEITFSVRRTPPLTRVKGCRRAQAPSTMLPSARGRGGDHHVQAYPDSPPTDRLADRAVVQGLTLAKALNAKATAVTVAELWDALSRAALVQAQVRNPVADYEQRMATAANRFLWSVGEKAKKLDVPCATIYAKYRHPATLPRDRRRRARRS